MFGFGRRICPERHLARSAFNLDIMYLLWAFDIALAKDPITGKAMPIDLHDVRQGLLAEPAPFECLIRPRSQTHQDIIRSDFAKAREVFSRFEHGSSAKDPSGNVYQW